MSQNSRRHNHPNLPNRRAVSFPIPLAPPDEDIRTVELACSDKLPVITTTLPLTLFECKYSWSSGMVVMMVEIGLAAPTSAHWLWLCHLHNVAAARGRQYCIRGFHSQLCKQIMADYVDGLWELIMAQHPQSVRFWKQHLEQLFGWIMWMLIVDCSVWWLACELFPKIRCITQ